MKKNVCLLFILVFIIIFGIYNVEASSYMSGDVDGNNTVGSTDYILIRKHILNNPKLTGDSLKRADVNGDNNVTSLDYIIIKKIILGDKSVTIPVREVNLNKTSLTLNVGENSTLTATINPTNATDKKVTYSSSDTSVATIDSSGKIVGKGKGSATIKATSNGINATCQVTVNQKTGVVEGTGGIWGYTASDVVTPKLADKEFFTNLARNGKGTMNNNTYTLTTSEGTYTYNTYNNTLKFNNRSILTMIYYPPNKDLSTVNTFTFFGGTGESDLGGYFKNIKKNPSKINSSGIIILISYTGSSYYGINGVYATNFVKSFVNQKSTCKNTVGGFSKGGPAAADAYELGDYSKLFILNSYFKDDGTRKKLPNAEIIFFITDQDGEYEYTIKGLNAARDYHYTNVILVSNYDKVNRQYKDNFLIYNPGSIMGSGHNYTNLINSNMFAYACS